MSNYLLRAIASEKLTAVSMKSVIETFEADFPFKLKRLQIPIRQRSQGGVVYYIKNAQGRSARVLNEFFSEKGFSPSGENLNLQCFGWSKNIDEGEVWVTLLDDWDLMTVYLVKG